jgi:PIN like domain
VIRYYLDADVLPLARVLGPLRDDVAYPGHPAAPEAKADGAWLPAVAEAGWLIISRDAHVEDHRAWIGAVAEHRAKLVVLSGRDARGTWGQLEILLTQWRAIEALANHEGPFIRAATRSGLRAVPLR